jgi:cytoskeletal protein CcmA (bactofilin family)
MTPVNSIYESAINIIGEGSELQGEMHFDQITRVHGVLKGNIRTEAGSTLILAETGVIEGNIQTDTLWVDGFVRGDIAAQTLVVVSRTGRVVGNIRAKNVKFEFGAYFEGKCVAEGEPTSSEQVL